MSTSMIGAALSVVGAALSPFKDSLLEKWAASNQLGSNVKDLELELLAVQALLEHTAGKQIVDNSALKRLLVRLQDLAYDADDVLDELDYFRIQDELDGTFDAADEHPKGCAHNLALHAKAVGKQIICLPACLTATTHGAKGSRRPQVNGGKLAKLTSRSAICNTSHSIGKCFPCSSLPSVCEDDDDDNRMNSSPQRNRNNDEPPELRVNRADASTRKQHTVEKLSLLKQKVSGIITTLCSNLATVVLNIAQICPITISPESMEPKIDGRDDFMNMIICDITEGGSFSDGLLTVLPIIGPRGVGKATLVRHIYHHGEVQKRFEVRVWTCVSQNFNNANELIEDIQKKISEQVNGESIGTARELIVQRLKNKRFLLVLDDMWDCSDEDEWKQLLAPFKKSHVLGNIIILTTQFPVRDQMRGIINVEMHMGPRRTNNSPQRNHTNDEPPKLIFNRVDASTKMQHIVHQLRLVRGIVSSTIATLGSNWSTIPDIAQSRHITTSEIDDQTKLHGRDRIMNEIICDITQDKYLGEVLSVIPIVGPGGIGKTTLAQNIYHNDKVEKHFHVKVWTCVSVKFNVNRLMEE